MSVNRPENACPTKPGEAKIPEHAAWKIRTLVH